MVRIFTGGTYFLPQSFLRNVLTSGFGGVQYRQFIDSLGFMMVDEIRNTPIGANILILALISTLTLEVWAK